MHDVRGWIEHGLAWTTARACKFIGIPRYAAIKTRNLMKSHEISSRHESASDFQGPNRVHDMIRLSTQCSLESPVACGASPKSGCKCLLVTPVIKWPAITLRLLASFCNTFRPIQQAILSQPLATGHGPLPRIQAISEQNSWCVSMSLPLSGSFEKLSCLQTRAAALGTLCNLTLLAQSLL